MRAKRARAAKRWREVVKVRQTTLPSRASVIEVMAPLVPVSELLQASGAVRREAMSAADTALRTVRLSDTSSRGGGGAIDPVTIERSTAPSSASPFITVHPHAAKAAMESRVAFAIKGIRLPSLVPVGPGQAECCRIDRC